MISSQNQPELQTKQESNDDISNILQCITLKIFALKKSSPIFKPYCLKLNRAALSSCSIKFSSKIVKDEAQTPNHSALEPRHLLKALPKFHHLVRQ